MHRSARSNLIQFSAGENPDVYIAHDDPAHRLHPGSAAISPAPENPSPSTRNFTLFHRSVNKDASLTLGSNSDDATTGKPLMYLVIAASAMISVAWASRPCSCFY